MWCFNWDHVETIYKEDSNDYLRNRKVFSDASEFFLYKVDCGLFQRSWVAFECRLLSFGWFEEGGKVWVHPWEGNFHFPFGKETLLCYDLSIVEVRKGKVLCLFKRLFCCEGCYQFVQRRDDLCGGCFVLGIHLGVVGTFHCHWGGCQWNDGRWRECEGHVRECLILVGESLVLCCVLLFLDGMTKGIQIKSYKLVLLFLHFLGFLSPLSFLFYIRIWKD